MQARSYNFVEKWLSYAKEHSEEDLFFPFFCSYLSLNYLYSEGGSREGPECRLMLKYVDRKLKDLRRKQAPFQLPDNIPCLESKDGVSYLKKDGRWEREKEGVFRDEMQAIGVDNNERERVLLVFWRIYRVRCNLFHGSKLVNDSRDRDLVRESTRVIEGFLKLLLSNGLVPSVAMV